MEKSYGPLGQPNTVRSPISGPVSIDLAKADDLVFMPGLPVLVLEAGIRL